MATLDLRDTVRAYINTADIKLLKMIKALAESYNSEEVIQELTEAQKKEVDKRLSRLEKGETKLFTLEETKEMLKL